MSQQTVSATSQIDGEAVVGGDGVTLFLYDIEEAGRLSLRTPYLVYYGVVEGRARIHVDDAMDESAPPRSFTAGESLVVPPLQSLVAEFPDANEAPTQYIALKVEREYVCTVLDDADEDLDALSTSRRWQLEEEHYCLTERREGVHRILRMIAHLFREDPPNRDRLIDLNVRELFLLLFHAPCGPLLAGDFSRHSSAGGLAAVVQYVQDHLDRHICIDELVEEACMSKSSFYRHFSEEFDMSPLEFITRERIIRARKLLSDPTNTVTKVGHALGFSSTSHFIDMFKEYEGKTPKQYQLDVTE